MPASSTSSSRRSSSNGLKPDVTSVVIATRNRARSLRRTLESLRLMSPPDDAWEIVVVDNASTDDTREAVGAYESAMPGVVRYTREERRGKSFAVNAGISEARGELLLFTDDDVIVDAGWCRALTAALQRTVSIGAGGRILAEWAAPLPAWLEPHGPDRLMNVVAFDAGDAPGELRTPPFGPNMAFRRDAFERYGPFRTDLGPGDGRYLPGQDTEFGRRLLAAGERLEWVPGAVVRHELQPDKMRKRYVASWYFGYGRMAVRTGASTPAARHWFGVPRYLFRSLALCLGRWAAGRTPARRVRHMAEACRHAGAIAEAFAIGRRRGAA